MMGSIDLRVIFKVEYAMEAVKQGSATVGVKSNTHAVLVALKRASSELSRYQSTNISHHTLSHDGCDCCN